MVRASTSFCEFWKSEFENSSVKSPDATQSDDHAKPVALGSLESTFNRPIAPTLSAAAAAGERTAVESTIPGFCGSSSSLLTRTQPAIDETPAASTIPAAPSHQARIIRLRLS